MNCKQTKTGDLVQVRECNQNDVTYGVVAVKLKNTCPDLGEAKNLVVAFMRHLQPTFAIQHTTGVSVESVLHQKGLAVSDYWQDVERYDWKVKSWTDGKTIAVLYIKNIGAVAVEKEEAFLNGRLFAGR